MKLAVVGGGSTYTPELVDGFARLRDALPVDELVLVDPAAERLELVGGLGAADLRPAGPPGTARHDRRPRRGRSTARDAVLLQLRVGGQAARNAGRDLAAGVRLRRAGDDRRGRPGQGAAHGPGRARHRRAGRRGSTGRLDHRLHQPGRHRDPGPAPGGAPGGRAVQRGDRLPAAASPRCSASPPESLELDHVGLNHLTWERARVRSDGVDVLPELLADARRGDRRAIWAAAPSCCSRSASCRPTTCATSTPTTRWSASSARQPSRAAEVAAMERRAAGAVRRPGAGREAGAAGAAGRRLLLRGRGAAGRVAAGRRTGVDARGEHCATAARCPSCPTTRSSRCRPGRPHRGARRCRLDAARAAVRRA